MVRKRKKVTKSSGTDTATPDTTGTGRPASGNKPRPVTGAAVATFLRVSSSFSKSSEIALAHALGSRTQITEIFDPAAQAAANGRSTIQLKSGNAQFTVPAPSSARPQGGTRPR